MASRDRSSLNPAALDRLRQLCRPGWLRSVILRRCIALILTSAAVVVTVIDHRQPPAPTALVAAHDLAPGTVLNTDDVMQSPVPDHLLPVDRPAIADIVGRRVTGPIQAGEIIGRHRLLDSRLPAALLGDSNARLVPVRPADGTLLTLVRVGDHVDVLSEESDVLARDAIVALVPQRSSSQSERRPGSALIAMRESAAHRVAAAGLRTAITFVLH
ncbi:SAF domain-containing protein [Gordonia zhaorongruii]|uniref:SAF domain-containing protein n=1 Tax=Gordonia zhaorongruii TaxID=2597659 RepID=UPI001642FF8A|nr:SAF domain-containing protein [Gordonia zhaorongruii]